MIADVVSAGVEAILVVGLVNEPYALRLENHGDYDAGCGLVETVSASDVGVSFQATFHYEDLTREPRLEITDDGQGTIIGGLFAGGKEWEFTQPGSMELIVPPSGWIPMRLVRDEGDWDIQPETEGQPDGIVFDVKARWHGTATENFSSEQTPVDLEVECLFASTVLLQYVPPDRIGATWGPAFLGAQD